ncbi:hypothetical protein PGTUg99_030975 [Puccinia graminis f. sp. tritici]|uniref:Uncharacterized protein n=1 Tax=Puccinia graminis f. sp. tritici TaxID=56615 RepID=A0A5B0MDG3_PUCGR|nr:hypothetical protein PGTUg99_030975 [Puccinia graminis f. sp. tritici]
MLKDSIVVLCLFLLSAGVSATRDPATGHSLGKKPSEKFIATASPTVASGIQASECSHNTRMSNQKFAWFKIDPSKVNQNGSTYGTCYATTKVPASNQLETNSGFNSFFWQKSGGQSGPGTGPIRDPNNGKAGYEDNTGKFHLGKPTSNGGGSKANNENATVNRTGSGGNPASNGRSRTGTSANEKPGSRGSTTSNTDTSTNTGAKQNQKPTGGNKA